MRTDVAIATELRPPPYGGSNQFLLALRGELRRRGLRVTDGRVARGARSVLLHSYLVDLRRRPAGRVVHRVDGPIGLYRGADDGADRRIVEINERLADATILQSRYSLDAHRELGLELRDPAERAELGARARRTVEERYSTPVVARKYGDFLETIA